FKRRSRIGDHSALGLYVHARLGLGVRVTVAHHFVASRHDALRYLRHRFAHRRIEQMAQGQAELVHKVEYPPDAHAQSIIAPAEVTRVWRRPQRGGRVPQALAEAEVFYVQRDIERQSLALGPLEWRALMNGRIIIAVMMPDMHGAPGRQTERTHSCWGASTMRSLMLRS